jgi:hypothetical protein
VKIDELIPSAEWRKDSWRKRTFDVPDIETCHEATGLRRAGSMQA